MWIPAYLWSLAAGSLCTLLVVTAILVSIGGALALAYHWEGKSPGPDDPPVDSDEEIAELERRVTHQEEEVGSGTWTARFVVWRNRKRLAELRRRRTRLREAQKRQETLEKGVCLPSALKDNPFPSFERPTFRGDEIRRDDDIPSS